MNLKVRPIASFESKTLLDYVKGNILREIKYACVRAKELDDKVGGKKKGSYLLAMSELADEINKELGIKTSSKKPTKKDKEALDKISKLEKELEDLQDTIKELEESEEETEKVLDEAINSVEQLTQANSDLTEANSALTSANASLNKSNEALSEKPEKAAKKPAAKKTAKKGAK